MTQAEKLRVTVVDDDRDLVELIKIRFEEAGFEVLAFYQGGPFLKSIRKLSSNLILLDVNLPDVTGFELLASLRRKDPLTPVIFLTGSHSEAHKIKGLNQGADDYVTKPFSMGELLARTQALLRRVSKDGGTRLSEGIDLADDPFQFCRAEVNPARLEVTFPGGERVQIGKKELGLMRFLTQNEEQVLTRATVIRNVWGPSANLHSRSLDQYVVKLRTLFAQHHCDASAFRTVHGVGYIYETEDLQGS